MRPGPPRATYHRPDARDLHRRRVRAVGQDRAASATSSTPWPGRSAGCPGVLDEPVDVFLPRYRSVPVPPGSRRSTTLPVGVPDPLAAGRADRGQRPLVRRRPAIGSAWSTTRRRSIATGSTATRRATTRTTPGASRSSAAPRWRPARRAAARRRRRTPRLARLPGAAPPRPGATPATRWSGRRPSRSRSTTSPTTAGRPQTGSASWGWAADGRDRRRVGGRPAAAKGSGAPRS